MATAYSYIRFSTPAQLKGDSLRRQLAKSERFASDNGLTLDTTYRDLGLSAFRGANRHKGALSEFLKKVEAGEIAEGSYLIVENLDRLTREDVLSAVSLFLQIIDAGIIVVTLNDDMTYSKRTIRERPNDLTVSISAFIKGNREQQDKSDRLREVWTQKRTDIRAGDRRKLTRQGPGWLTLVPDDPSEPLIGEWVPNTRHQTVVDVFRWCIEGMGKEAIARKLNSEARPTFKGGDGWQASTVGLLLSDRRVLGELQFRTKRDGGRQALDEPIQNYFARIISDETFYLAQAAVANRHCGAAVGRRGKVPNFFVGIARCQCGRSMEYRDKRNKRNPGPRNAYLICSGAQRQHACSNRTHFIYADVEALVLDWVSDIRVIDGFTERAADIRARLTALLALGDETKRRLDEALEEWSTATVPAVKSSLLKMADRLGAELAANDTEISDLQRRQVTSGRQVFEDGRAALKAARAELAMLEGDRLFEARAKLAAALRQVIDHVEFADSDGFTAYLKGGVKAYHFREGRFSHEIDVRESSWMRFPSAREKRDSKWYGG